MEIDGIIEQMVLPEIEILETSEHDKKLKNVRQNMTTKDNCKLSEYSEVLETSDDHPSETPRVVSTSVESEEPVIGEEAKSIQRVVEVEDEDSNKTNVVTDSGNPDDTVISEVDENSDNTDVFLECEGIFGPSDITKVEEE